MALSSKPARKGTTEAASNAAAIAFGSQSGLTLNPASAVLPPEQQGRRRLNDSYLIQRSKLVPDPEQPRKEFDPAEMEELTSSIRTRGIKQPLIVRWSVQDSRYMIIDGGRRFEAAVRLGLEELPCWIQQGDRRDILIDQIVHNWQRSSLRPWETADALARLRDEFQLSQRELCEVTGKPKSEISKLLALHDNVVPAVQTLARSDTDSPLTTRHLYNISKLKPEQQIELAERVKAESLSAFQTEEIVASLTPKASAKAPKVLKKSQGLSSRQRRFKTSQADVLVTFHRVGVTTQDILQVLDELREGLEKAE